MNTTPSKFQLNSGAIPEELYRLYHDAARIFKQPVSIEVAEAVRKYAPLLAAKCAWCSFCLRSLPKSLLVEEREEIKHCPYCGKTYQQEFTVGLWESK